MRCSPGPSIAWAQNETSRGVFRCPPRAWTSTPALEKLPAAVYDEGLTGDHRAVIAGQEDGGSDDVLGLETTLDGPPGHPVGLGIGDEVATGLGEGESRSEGVDTDAVVAQLARHHPREPDQRALGGDVV